MTGFGIIAHIRNKPISSDRLKFNKGNKAMNMKFRNYILAAALFVGVLSGQSLAQAGNSGGGRLAGTWDATVSITNCATGDVLSTFQSTGTFHAGGTFTGITSGTPPSMRSPEAGVWRHEGAGTYQLRFKAYLFNPAGAPTAYQIVTHNVELDKNNLDYTSSGDARIFAMNGTQIGAGCSSAVGTRMVLD